MNPYPEYTLPDFVQSFRHECSKTETEMCECSVCNACNMFINQCTKCMEVRIKMQELKDLMDNHIYQFREELMHNEIVNYKHIDAIQIIHIRIKQLQSIIPR